MNTASLIRMMHEVKDQLGNQIVFSFPPERIISVVPSQTELLFDLGLDEEIVGITRFCIHPEEKCRTKRKIGGTKKLDLLLIDQLKPDIIIANKEENARQEIKWLQARFPVYVSDINNLGSALDMISAVGGITNKVSEAEGIAKSVRSDFGSIPQGMNSKVAYFIWRKPFMSVGQDTFIHDMLSRMGLRNVFESRDRYPIVTEKEISAAQPELIFLSSEPYPFSDKHREEFQSICPEAKVVLVDGEYFSWYGSRLLGAANYFKNLSARLNSL